MTILRLLTRRFSLMILVATLLLALAIGGLQAFVARYVHGLDCDAISARNHPRCQPQVTLLLNGKISTLAEPPEVEALAVRGGEILAMGSTDALKSQFPDANKIDLNGYRAFPGFQDVRVRLLDGGLGLARLNLEPAADQKRTLELIEAFVKGHPDDPWLIGQGWSMTAMAGQPPSLKMLDDLLADRPMFLWRDDLHVAVVNSEGLRWLGLSKSSKDPVGGRIDRDRAGAPTGLLEGAAAHDAWTRLVTALPSRFVKMVLLDAQEQLLSLGLTRVADEQRDPSSLVALGELYEAGLWRLRVAARPPLSGGAGWAYAFYRSPDPDTLQAAGPVAQIDGDLAGRLAALSLPYPDNSPTIAPTTNGSALGSALRSSRPSALLEATGDAALTVALEGLEQAGGLERPAVAGLVWSDTALQKAKQLGVVPVIAPERTVHWPILRAQLPDALAALTFHYQSMIKAGLSPAFGSGWPERTAAPLLHLQKAISNQDDQGESVMPEWYKEEMLTLDQAINACTRTPARLLGREAREGTLEVGHLADLVVLDRDLLTKSPLEFDTTQVVMTIIGGEVVWRREGGLQFRIADSGLGGSPHWLKVLARQHFMPLVLLLSLGAWPIVVILLTMWRRRPRPEPLKVIAGGPDLP